MPNFWQYPVLEMVFVEVQTKCLYCIALIAKILILERHPMSVDPSIFLFVREERKGNNHATMVLL
jgi:hypothetical protein